MVVLENFFFCLNGVYPQNIGHKENEIISHKLISGLGKGEIFREKFLDVRFRCEEWGARSD